MKSIGADVVQLNALPSVNQMIGMQYKIVPIQLYKCVCTILIQNRNINLHCKPPFSRLLRHTWEKEVMLFYSYIIRAN